jgi:hypothetical protein
VQVYSSNTRPHYLPRRGPEDGVLIRVGSSNRKEVRFGRALESLAELMAHGGKTEPVQFPGQGAGCAPTNYTRN